ncbi:MAG TPA: hypothetical protein PKW81_07785 [Synergistales bacterium]|nr:hypothetical protein [Synergistales bacterium]
MPLMQVWRSDPESVLQMSIAQLVAIAGDGRPADGSDCQEELHSYLNEASTDSLAEYASSCLDNPFVGSGFVLQDIVNELGRRLDYSVENGKYRGMRNAIGYDGLWKEGGGDYSLVVEVKTTDAYRVEIDRVAGYRESLIRGNIIPRNSSVLIVVGRTDTGELEAQVRGSRHAWDMRIIGVRSLIQLVRVKESADNEETIQKIKTLLRPVEYTRLDSLVDVVFATAKDIEGSDEDFAEERVENGGKTIKQERTPKAVISAVRDSIIKSLSERFNTPLLRKTRALFSSPDGKTRVASTVSKRYEGGKYWYAYHQGWDRFLKEGDAAYLALGCVDQIFAFLLPRGVITNVLDNLYFTEKEGVKLYWHLRITEPKPNVFFLQVPTPGVEDISLEEFIIPLKDR